MSSVDVLSAQLAHYQQSVPGRLSPRQLERLRALVGRAIRMPIVHELKNQTILEVPYEPNQLFEEQVEALMAYALGEGE